MSGTDPTVLVPNHAMTAAEMAAIDRYGVLARGNRATSSTATATIIGVLRLDNVVLLNGRAYRIHTSGLNLLSSVAGDDILAEVRWATGGAATITSAKVPGAHARGRMIVGGSGSPIIPINSLWRAGAGTYSFLLCVARSGGTGNVQIFGSADYTIDLWIEDCGLDVSDTGVDI